MKIAAGLLALVTLGATAAPGGAGQPPGHTHDGHSHAQEKGPSPHPEPRPGVTGAAIEVPEDATEGTRRAFLAARRLARIFDGLYCHCDCHDRDKLRSLLSCFENGMAASCSVCMREAALVVRLHGQGKTLQEIRAAVDRANS